MCKKYYVVPQPGGGLKPFFLQTLFKQLGFTSIMKEQSYFELLALKGDNYHKDLKILDKDYVLQIS